MARLREAIGEDGDTSWDDVEETLIAGDVGAALAMDVVEQGPGGARPRRAPRPRCASSSAPSSWRATSGREPRPAGEGQPAVVLVVGVNGTARRPRSASSRRATRREGRSVDPGRRRHVPRRGHRAAPDLGRARRRAASSRTRREPIPAAVVYDALDAAVARGADLVIADTAGRLHTKANLMDELTKIRRIVDKRLPGAQPETLFVLDATTGQNGLAQARAFHEAVGLTGIVLTKLDSTAKGGIVFAIEDALDVPVRFVGVGSRSATCIRFDPDAFVDALFA